MGAGYQAKLKMATRSFAPAISDHLGMPVLSAQQLHICSALDPLDRLVRRCPLLGCGSERGGGRGGDGGRNRSRDRGSLRQRTGCRPSQCCNHRYRTYRAGTAAPEGILAGRVLARHAHAVARVVEVVAEQIEQLVEEVCDPETQFGHFRSLVTALLLLRWYVSLSYRGVLEGASPRNDRSRCERTADILLCAETPLSLAPRAGDAVLGALPKCSAR